MRTLESNLAALNLGELGLDGFGGSGVRAIGFRVYIRFGAVVGR